jgi:hypothetical protein
MDIAQRLANGNTLLTESSFGRFFEVTREGEIVWGYVNPFFGRPFFGGPAHSQTNQVFRALRYSPEEIARARSRIMLRTATSLLLMKARRMAAAAEPQGGSSRRLRNEGSCDMRISRELSAKYHGAPVFKLP